MNEADFQWLSGLSVAREQRQSCTVVSVLRTRGSAPRAAGTKMAVTSSRSYGTIGGGQLEFRAMAIARQSLEHRQQIAVTRRFSLGPDIGQCCGGVVWLRFETFRCTELDWVDDLWSLVQEQIPVVRVTFGNADEVLTSFVGKKTLPQTSLPAVPEDVRWIAEQQVRAEPLEKHLDYYYSMDQRDFFLDKIRPDPFCLWVFGAGHVGREVVNALAGLAHNLWWFDSRKDLFPTDLPRGVENVVAAQPERAIDAASPNTYYLVMTHSHALDQALCERILGRGDAAYCGLIGSNTKRRRFERHMQENGLTPAEIAHLTCPIGIPNITSKHPKAIAIAVVAEILAHRESALAAVKPRSTEVA